MDLSYCVVNTNGRDYLRACLSAIERTHPAGLEHEILVLDNRSDDGSAEMVRDEWPAVRLFARDRRAGKAENDSTLLREARGRYCLLLNEDSELCEGAAQRPPGGDGRAPRRRRGGGPPADQRGSRDRMRLAAARAYARRSPPRPSCTAATPFRAAGRRPARSAGPSRAR
ncbi:MAG: glycosyltransferase [Thermoleophilaceae bacterium]